MIGGFILGFIAGIIIFFGGISILDNIHNEDGIAFKLTFSFTILMAIGSIIVGSFIGINLDNYSLKEDIEGYSAIKSTYESAIADNSLTSLERLQIVDTAIDQNKSLARRQVTIDAWWNFALKRELKDELKALKPIGMK